MVDGFGLGDDDGLADGSAVGFRVGTVLGLADGKKVGGLLCVGYDDGEAVGLLVGREGVADGVAVGIRVGERDGATVGNLEGEDVGFAGASVTNCR